MSAIVNPTPASSPAPPLAPQPVPAIPRKPSRWKWLLLVIAVVAAIAGVRYLLRPAVEEKPAVALTIRTAPVVRGTLQRTVRITGTTSAKNYANISAPMMRGPDAGRSLILIQLAKSGSFVKKGELVAQIDPQSIKDHVEDLTALVDQAEADVRKAKAELAIQLETQRQAARQDKADMEKAGLDAGAAQIRSDIDKEELKLSVEESEAVYKEAMEDLKTLETSQKAQLRVLDLTRERHTRHRNRHKVDVTRFTIHAPIAGLIVMTTVWRGGDMGQVQQGDQVSPGQPFMKIVDVSSMQIEATINQAESEGLRLGQTAEINFDAFPDLHLSGRVDAVGALAVGGWRQNYFIRNVPVRVALTSTDPRVIPDLSSSANVLVSNTESLIVPREAVMEEGDKPVVYVKKGDRYAAREVRPGPQNHTQTAILEGLKAGEEVALQKPTLLKAGR